MDNFNRSSPIREQTTIASKEQRNSIINGKKTFTVAQIHPSHGASAMKDRNESAQYSASKPFPNQHRSVGKFRKAIMFVGALFNTLVVLGLPYSFGTFYTDLLETFTSTRWETTLVQSIFVGISTGAGIPVGFFLHRFGVRRTMMAGSVLSFLGLFSSWFASSLVYLMITIGGASGFGGCMVYMSTTAMVAMTYDKKRGIALAAILAMSGLGPVIFPKLLEVLKISYGLRGTFLICSGFYLNTLLPAINMASSELKISPREDGSERSLLSKLRALRHPVFIAYCIVSAICISALNFVVVVVIDLSLSKGLSREDGTNYLLIVNCLITVFGILIGFVKLLPRVHGAAVFCLCSILSGVGILILPYADSYGYITACLTVYGVAFGGSVGIQSVAVLDSVGQEVLVFGMGVRGSLIALGNPLMAVLLGWLFDETGSYTMSFLVVGTSTIVASLLTLVTVLLYSCVHGRRKCNRVNIYHIRQS